MKFIVLCFIGRDWHAFNGVNTDIANFGIEITAFWAVLANQSIRKHGFGITRKLAKKNVQLLIHFGKLKLADMSLHHYRVQPR